MGQVTALTERQRIEFLLGDWLFWGSTLYPQLHLSRATRFGMLVDLSVFTGQREQGDVDILFCDPDRPNEAVAVECKSLTITRECFAHGDVYRLHNLGNAVPQAAKLLKLGFSRTYLLALVAVDASGQTEYNLPNRGPTPEHYRTISDALLRAEVDERVGVLCLFTTQLTERDIIFTGGMSPWLWREAKAQVQPAELTARVRAYSPQLREQPYRPFTFSASIAELLARQAGN